MTVCWKTSGREPILTLRRSESTDCVMSLYFGTSAKSLSYVGCKPQQCHRLLRSFTVYLQC